MTGLPGFTVDIDQNPYLPVGGRDVSAIVTVTADAAGRAGRPPLAPDGGSAEIIIIDCSGRWTTRRPSSPRPARPPRPRWT